MCNADAGMEDDQEAGAEDEQGYSSEGALDDDDDVRIDTEVPESAMQQQEQQES